MEKLIKNKKTNIIKKSMLLLKSLREYKKYAILSVLFITLEATCECIIPYVMQMLLNIMKSVSNNEMSNDQVLTNVGIYAGILIALAIGSLFCGVCAGIVSAKASSGFSKNLREDEFKKITTFSFNNIDKFSASSLITRQTTDIGNIQMAFMMLIRIVVRAPLMFFIALVMAIIVAPQLSWIFAITIPLMILFNLPITIIAYKKFQPLFDRYDELNEIVNENVRGIRVVKTYVREDFKKEQFRNESYDMSKGFAFVERLLSLTNPLIQVCFYVSNSLLYFIGGYILIQQGTNYVGGLTVGALSSLITYSAQTLSSLTMISFSLFMILMAVPCINRVYEVMIEEPSIKPSPNAIKEMDNGEIIFENVSFKYKETAKKYALSNINLHINSGETIGIIGSTGSSKSTLVNLISRFYDVSEGNLYVGGHNVKDYDIQFLRNNVSMVLQKNILFSGTVKSNLQWGNPDCSDEDIKKACDIAQASSFIEVMKDGYDSICDQGGVNFSGGQKQRLCIARALLKNPKILILDDSTSAVDTKTDAYIQKGLKEYMPHVTKIIIAQRLSSIQEANKIVVMDNGTINGIGSHEELLKNNKIYQEIYDIQSKIGGVENE